MGQIGQAFSNPNTFAANPQGFNGGEWAARFMGAGAKGLAQGLQAPRYSAQNIPGAMSDNNGSMWAGDSQVGARGRANPYFYGYGQ